MAKNSSRYFLRAIFFSLDSDANIAIISLYNFVGKVADIFFEIGIFLTDESLGRVDSIFWISYCLALCLGTYEAFAILVKEPMKYLK